MDFTLNEAKGLINQFDKLKSESFSLYVKEVSTDTILKNTDIIIDAEIVSIKKVTAVSTKPKSALTPEILDYIKTLPKNKTRVFTFKI